MGERRGEAARGRGQERSSEREWEAQRGVLPHLSPWPQDRRVKSLVCAVSLGYGESLLLLLLLFLRCCCRSLLLVALGLSARIGAAHVVT